MKAWFKTRAPLTQTNKQANKQKDLESLLESLSPNPRQYNCNIWGFIKNKYIMDYFGSDPACNLQSN